MKRISLSLLFLCPTLHSMQCLLGAKEEAKAPQPALPAVVRSPEMVFPEVIVIAVPGDTTPQSESSTPESTPKSLEENKGDQKAHHHHRAPKLERISSTIDNNRTKVKLAIIAAFVSIVGSGVTLAIHFTK